MLTSTTYENVYCAENTRPKGEFKAMEWDVRLAQQNPDEYELDLGQYLNPFGLFFQTNASLPNQLRDRRCDALK